MANKNLDQIYADAPVTRIDPDDIGHLARSSADKGFKFIDVMQPTAIDLAADSGGDVAWDVTDYPHAALTLDQDANFSAPTNMRDGVPYILMVTQDGTGGWTPTWNAVFKWPNGIAPTIDQTATTGFAVFIFVSDGTNMYGELLYTSETIAPRELMIAISDESSNLTTGTGKSTFRMPGAGQIIGLPRINVNTAPTGAPIIVDVNKNGTTILSTKLTIDASEKTSTTAATPAVVSVDTFADDDEFTVDIDQIGSTIAGKGLKLTIFWQPV